MKKLVSIVLLSVLLLSLVSCSGRETVGDDTTKDTEKNVQNYDDLEYKSEDRFSDSQLLTLKTDEGELQHAKDSMLLFMDKGVATEIPFIDPKQNNHSGVVMPFGAKIGDSAGSFADKYSLDTGYAAFVEKGSDIAMYESGKLPEFKNGGYIYFGYALDGTGKWAFMDYYMLVFLMKGQLDVRGYDDTYNVIVYCCTVNNDGNISLVTELYGNLAKVMAITSGQ